MSGEREDVRRFEEGDVTLFIREEGFREIYDDAKAEIDRRERYRRALEPILKSDVLRSDPELVRRILDAHATNFPVEPTTPDPKLLDPPEPGSSESMVIDFRAASEALIRALAREPALLHRLHWRRFEELVAHLLERQGFEVELTPPSGDRGVDIYARRQGALGPTLYVVECKKYRLDRPVGPDLVRALYGVVERERASGGILATTSVFTAGARAEVEGELAYRMSLRDGDDIIGWADKQG
jgi:restriction system protein